MANLIDLIKGEGAAISFIREAFNAGKAATETLSALREAGLGMRTQTFYQVYNYFAGPITTASKYVGAINLNALPTLSRLPQSLTATLRNFSYQVRVSGTDVNTGEAGEQFVTVSTNTLLTKQQAMDIAINMVEGAAERYGLEAEGARVTEITQNVAGIVQP